MPDLSRQETREARDVPLIQRAWIEWEPEGRVLRIRSAVEGVELRVERSVFDMTGAPFEIVFGGPEAYGPPVPADEEGRCTCGWPYADCREGADDVSKCEEFQASGEPQT